MATTGFIFPCRPRLILLSLSTHRHPTLPTCPRSSAMTITSVASDRAARDRPWVGTHSVHNALVKNHFLDLLEVHGARFAAVPDDAYPGYDPAGSHALRMRRLANEFRRQVIGAFARRVGFADVACVSAGSVNGPATAEREKTEIAMRERKPMIVGAVVADDERRLIGRIPMLLRADVAEELLHVKMQEHDEGDINGTYVAVGVKRRGVETNRDGKGIIRANALGRVQAEMWLWNRLLAGVQGTDLGAALLIGLHPKRKKAIQLGAVPSAKAAATDDVGKQDLVFDESVWRVARVPFGDAECTTGIAALEALAWRVDVIDDGEAWIAAAVERAQSEAKSDEEELLLLATGATDPRMRPNMKCANMYDAPWSRAKRKVAEALRELTLVSGVSHAITSEAMAKGFPNDYADRRVTAAALDIGSQYTKTTLEMCKPSYDGPVVKPALIPHNRFNWRRLQGFSNDDHFRFDTSDPELPFADERTFYVDFELASPEYLYTTERIKRDGQPEDEGPYSRFFDVTPSLPIQEDSTTDSLIFMIGCGQVVNGQWQHRVFTSSALSIVAESAVIREWLEYMHSAMPPDVGQPFLNVWGPEQQLLRKSMRRMTGTDRDAVKDIRFFKVVNVLQVVTTACLTIKGNLSNSLKMVCSTLDGHGLLDIFKQREEEDVVTNGADAMTLGLDSAEVAIREGLGSLAEAPKMAQIARYNEADCRDIARVITYLRKRH